MVQVRRAVLSVLFLVAPAAAQSDGNRSRRHPKLSPFTAVRSSHAVPEVEFAGEWYELEALDGTPAARIVEFCQKTYGGSWEKRFAEDLVMVLAEMGKPAKDKVSLDLRHLGTGELVHRKDAEMTEANRARVWSFRNEPEGRAHGETARVSRKHATEPKAEFLALAALPAAVPSPRLTRRQAEADLDQLEWILEHEYSYRSLRGVDLPGALDAVRCGLGEGIERNQLALQVAKVLALFGDGHTRLRSGTRDLLLPGSAPLRVRALGARLAVFDPEGVRLLESEHPWLDSLDGVPVARWLAAAESLVARGTPDFVRRHAARLLPYLAWLRHELKLPASPTVRVGLKSDTGAVRTRELRLQDELPPMRGGGPSLEHRILDGDLGYLRIRAMDDGKGFLAGIDAAMAACAKTKGLIADVRGNGGGSRAALERLFPHFMAPGDPPRVANVAAVLLQPGDPADATEGQLADRELFPVTSSRFGEPARAVLAPFAAAFRPEWQPPAGRFSAWHYFLLERSDPRVPAHYAAPVVVLMDEGCFSATDIFLGAMKGWRNVTLLGTQSGGGSGRARSQDLEHSGIRFQVSSMASFRPDGRLYDGRGIEPDVVVEPTLDDLLGRTDSQLQAACQRLR
jgi:hypothetical protein